MVLKYPTPDEVQSREYQEALFQAVAEEIRNHGILKQGLWAKDFADAMGEEAKAKALYIKYRAQSLLDESFKYQEEQEQIREQERIARKREALEDEIRRRECQTCRYHSHSGFCARRQTKYPSTHTCDYFVHRAQAGK